MRAKGVLAALAGAGLVVDAVLAGCAIDFDQFGPVSDASAESAQQDATSTPDALDQADSGAGADGDTDAGAGTTGDAARDARAQEAACPPGACFAAARSCGIACSQQAQQCVAGCPPQGVPQGQTCRQTCTTADQSCVGTCESTCIACAQDAGCPSNSECLDAARATAGDASPG